MRSLVIRRSTPSSSERARDEIVLAHAHPAGDEEQRRTSCRASQRVAHGVALVADDAEVGDVATEALAAATTSMSAVGVADLRTGRGLVDRDDLVPRRQHRRLRFREHVDVRPRRRSPRPRAARDRGASPLRARLRPARTSLPRRAMNRPGAVARAARGPSSPSFSTSSTGTTPSAPAGSGAPVMIAIACPFAKPRAAVVPAAISPTTSQLDRDARRRPRCGPRIRPSSSCRTADNRDPRGRPARAPARPPPRAATSTTRGATAAASMIAIACATVSRSDTSGSLTTDCHLTAAP